MIRVHFDQKELEPYDLMEVDMATSSLEFLDQVADQLGVAYLSRFVQEGGRGFTGASHDTTWFLAAEGLQTLEILSHFLKLSFADRDKVFVRSPAARRMRRVMHELEEFGVLSILVDRMDELETHLKLAALENTRFCLTVV